MLCLHSSLELNSNLYNAYTNFSIAFKQISFNSSNPKLYPPLIKLLTSKNLVSPWHIAKSILNLLKHDPKIKDLLLDKNFDVDIKQVEYIIKV